LPAGTRLGDFEVTGVVHRGSYGIVYAGEDRSSQRKIAVTEYLPARLAERMADGNVGVRSLRHQQSFRDGKQRFLSEAGYLQRSTSPRWSRSCVLGAARHGLHGDALDEGQTLSDVLRNSPKPAKHGSRQFWAFAGRAGGAPQVDCYPYDVTPDNIVVLDDGTPCSGRRRRPSRRCRHH
jgi:hypothetical protein